MRQGSGARRGRGRGNGRKPNRNQTFDSNGPSVRLRGTAAQLYEKYLSLARDASGSGDRVGAENCFQHADHYYRILAAQSAPPDNQQQQQQQSADRAQSQGNQNQGQNQAQNQGQDQSQNQAQNQNQAHGQGSGNGEDSQSFNGREPRRQANGGLRDGDPRSRSGQQDEQDDKQPLDEGLHRMLGEAPAPSDDADGDGAPDADGAPDGDGAPAGDATVDLSEEKPAQEAEAGKVAKPDAADDAPAPRRRRRRTASEPKDEDPGTPSEAAD